MHENTQSCAQSYTHEREHTDIRLKGSSNQPCNFLQRLSSTQKQCVQVAYMSTIVEASANTIDSRCYTQQVCSSSIHDVRGQ